MSDAIWKRMESDGDDVARTAWSFLRVERAVNGYTVMTVYQADNGDIDREYIAHEADLGRLLALLGLPVTGEEGL